MSPVFNRQEVQGNILRGYRRDFVRHLILEITDRAAARKFLGVSVAGGNADVPGITSEAPWSEKPAVCFNIGLTYEGLRALGTPEKSLATLPTEFKEGMTSRALKLGDFGLSAPSNWPAPFDKPARVHIIATIYADDTAHLDRVQAQVARPLNVLGVRDGRNLADNKVFFGYVDNISQPRFAGIRGPDQNKVDEPLDPLGTVLLGYPTRTRGAPLSRADARGTRAQRKLQRLPHPGAGRRGVRGLSQRGSEGTVGPSRRRPVAGARR